MQAGRTSRHRGRLVCAILSSLCLQGSLSLLGPCHLKPQPLRMGGEHCWGNRPQATPKPSLASRVQNKLGQYSHLPELLLSLLHDAICSINPSSWPFYHFILRWGSQELAANPLLRSPECWDHRCEPPQRTAMPFLSLEPGLQIGG